MYIHKISEDRFTGVNGKNFRMFRKLCGEKTLKNVILMTNMWGRVTPQQGAARERQLKDKYFKEAIEKGAQMCRHNNTPESARAILQRIIHNRPLALRIQHELVDEQKDIGQTGAGVELIREICMLMQAHREELKDLEERDEVSRRELEKGKSRLQEEMERLWNESTEMQGTMADLQKRLESIWRCVIM